MEKMRPKSPKSLTNAAAPRPSFENSNGTNVRPHPTHPIELTKHSPKRKGT